MEEHDQERVKKHTCTDEAKPIPPKPPSPNGNGGTPTKRKDPHSGTPRDTDQVMDDQITSNTPQPRWSDEENEVDQDVPITQADLLENLHKSLESAVNTLNQLSIHAICPERTFALV